MNTPVILAFASAGFSGALAVAALWQGRRSLSHWLFTAGMLVLAVERVLAGMSLLASDPKETASWQDWRLFAMSFLPGVWLAFSLTYARGNYREFLAKWRYALIAMFVLPTVLAALFLEKLTVTVQSDQSVAAWMHGLGLPAFLIHLILLAGNIIVLMNLERTYRAAIGTMRWRIKFMVLGLAVLFMAGAYSSSQVLLFRGIKPGLDPVNSIALILACLLITRSLFRAGHFELSVYPSHAVLQNSLTVLLAGIYLLVVGLLAKALALLGSDANFALKAFVVLLALVLLALVLLSDRVRLQTRRFVSRHFRRPLYDYRSVWRSFSEGTATVLGQAELCRSTIKLVADTFQVLSVTMWLVDDKKENLVFAGSTSLSDAKGAELGLPSRDAVEVIRAFQEQPEPMDIDLSKKNWATALRRCHPDEFHKGGSRVGVPLMVAGEILGVITLGDRVGGLAFSQQDFDLLKCVGDQTAASLRNVQLSGKLLQAKELEAFQTMSAFFVHDLKNTASTLSLMLQNLPVHFNDPGFREDALRGIGKTVAHIDHLIARLSLLRRGLEIQPAESDLNEVVGRALTGWQGSAEVDLVKELRPLPKIFIDSDQILKVVTNLVLNAKEAVRQKGAVRVETSQLNGWGVLTVSDDGCGMPPEFLSRSLFRPFQTTKKGGFGIGMFQSKMIVEAHGGRIEVASEQNKGTTFKVFLPVPKAKP